MDELMWRGARNSNGAGDDVFLAAKETKDLAVDALLALHRTQAMIYQYIDVVVRGKYLGC